MLKGKWIRLECAGLPDDTEGDKYYCGCNNLDFADLTFAACVEQAKNAGWLFVGKKYYCPYHANILRNKSKIK